MISVFPGVGVGSTDPISRKCRRLCPERATSAYGPSNRSILHARFSLSVIKSSLLHRQLMLMAFAPHLLQLCNIEWVWSGSSEDSSVCAGRGSRLSSSWAVILGQRWRSARFHAYFSFLVPSTFDTASTRPSILTHCFRRLIVVDVTRRWSRSQPVNHMRRRAAVSEAPLCKRLCLSWTRPSQVVAPGSAHQRIDLQAERSTAREYDVRPDVRPDSFIPMESLDRCSLGACYGSYMSSSSAGSCSDMPHRIVHLHQGTGVNVHSIRYRCRQRQSDTRLDLQSQPCKSVCRALRRQWERPRQCTPTRCLTQPISVSTASPPPALACGPLCNLLRTTTYSCHRGPVTG